MCGNERENIKAIENSGQTLGDLMNICVGIATLKDEVYFIDPIAEDDKYYYVNKKNGEFKIEKAITKPLVKISDMKIASDIETNKRRIIFPYKSVNRKVTAFTEEELGNKYPFCFEYLLSVKGVLESRGKGKHIYSPFTCMEEPKA